MIDKNNVPNEYFEPNLNFRSIGPQVSAANLIFVKLRSRSHNCNAHQSEGRVGIFKYNLHMQVVGAFFASYLQTVLF